jgi:hypothetical protein
MTEPQERETIMETTRHKARRTRRSTPAEPLSAGRSLASETEA